MTKNSAENAQSIYSVHLNNYLNSIKNKQEISLLHLFFEHSVDKYPENIAIEDGNVKFTYLEVDKQANRLAHYLKKQGLVPDQKVGIFLPRSAFVYIAMLGVLKAGGAYIPIDPEIPGDRVDFILDDANALLLISSESCLNRIGTKLHQKKIVNLDIEGPLFRKFPSSRLRNNTVKTDNLCYLIYTSGTSGKPKGVQLEHKNVVTYIYSALKIYPIGPDDRALQGFTVSFDASVEEIWVPFAVGATVVVGSLEVMHSGDMFSDTLNRLKISFLSCAPTLLSMVEDPIPSLKILIFGGEVCPEDLSTRWCRKNLIVYNTYGPTESAVIATYKVLKANELVTIGVPLPGYLVLVLDEQMEPVTVGDTGELFIGGDSIARGYLNRSDLNAQKFIEMDKFTGYPVRFFKTGDRATYVRNGDIQFLGRLDAQVKVRGFRIELSEIEGLLMKASGVRACAVSLNQAAQQLAAYVVLSDGQRIDRKEIAAILQSALPTYMIPLTLDVIDALPMTASSKLDREKLPSPVVPLYSRTKEHVLPVSNLEKSLVDAMNEAFGRTDISMLDHFFDDLGGHSLWATKVVSILRKNKAIENISVVDIYKFSVLKDLAAELEHRKKTEPSQIKPEQDVYRPSTLRYYSCWFMQGIALIFLAFLFGLEWLGPFFVYSYYYYADYSVLDSLLIMLLAYFAVLPVITILTILLKWMVIGRIKPGKYRMWGWYYFRFWFVDKIVSISPAGYFAGTPILNLYYRVLGAKIGKNTYINTETASVFDLLSVGDNVSICTDTHMKGYNIRNGYLHIGSIIIEDDCFVGSRCYLSENSKMEKNASLEDLSMIQPGVTVLAGEIWQGLPASKIGNNLDTGTVRVWKKSHFWLYLVGVFIIPLITMIAYFPGMMLITHIDYIHDDYRFLALTIVVSMSFVLLLSLIIAGLKWILLGNIKEGKYPVASLFYYKKWFFDQLMKLSLQVIGTLYTTLYLRFWFKILGVKIGKRSEISTVEFISPDLLIAGDECFLADSVSIGASHVRNGYITIAKTYIGARTFVGNSAVVSPGTVLGNDVLVGVLSKMKEEDIPAPNGTSWFGSPAVFLPKRDVNDDFPITRTYKPTKKLYVLRYFIEFFRVTLPATLFIMMASLINNAASYLQMDFDLGTLLVVFPFLYIGASLLGFLILAFFKWTIIGKYKPDKKPLWSGFVWRSELVTGLYENFGVLFFLSVLTGTPFIKLPLKLLGCKIGKRTCIYTTQITEFDLVKVGDYAVLNDNCTLQTHLFEDRVMKMSYVDIGKDCSVGGMSVVLYDSKMEDGSRLENLSVLMKGETLAAGVEYIGAPTNPIR